MVGNRDQAWEQCLASKHHGRLKSQNFQTINVKEQKKQEQVGVCDWEKEVFWDEVFVLFSRPNLFSWLHSRDVLLCMNVVCFAFCVLWYLNCAGLGCSFCFCFFQVCAFGLLLLIASFGFYVCCTSLSEAQPQIACSSAGGLSRPGPQQELMAQKEVTTKFTERKSWDIRFHH